MPIGRIWGNILKLVERKFRFFFLYGRAEVENGTYVVSILMAAAAGWCMTVCIHSPGVWGQVLTERAGMRRYVLE